MSIALTIFLVTRHLEGTAASGHTWSIRPKPSNVPATEPGDAHELAAVLGQLIEDHSEAQRMGSAGAREAREQFSEEVHLRAITDVYAEARSHWAER